MKVLIVDDSAAMVALLASRLEELGYAVVVAANGQAGADLFATCRPDLVLMDLEMPVLNGYGATRLIRAIEARQRWAWTPVLFLTAASSEDSLVTAIEAGADDFIAKSASEEILRAKMQAMARIAALRNDLRAAHEQLEGIANRDGLTGIANRRALDQWSDEAWARAVEAASSFSLLMVDLDNFKRFNDAYGHLAGDDCLRAIAEAIAETAKQACDRGVCDMAISARYGGEEFALLLSGGEADGYRDTADHLVRRIRQCAIAHDHNPPWGIVTASVGGCRFERAQGHIKAIFRAADACLYRAKAEGRNRVVHHTSPGE
ncbi:MAG: diguanylate cyclase [Pseudomonadota bacterium]|nr:diguanylate cyclase [Pseudomonadota bacterium]